MKSEQTKWDGGPWLKKGLGQGAEELGVRLNFERLETELRKCQVERLEEEVRNQRWQGSLVTTR